MALAVAMATSAAAQTPLEPRQGGGRLVEVMPGQSFTPRSGGASVQFRERPVARTDEAPEIFQTNSYGVDEGAAWASTTREVRRRGADHIDSLSVRQAGRIIRPSGAPFAPGSAEAIAADSTDVRFRREWPTTLARSEDGLELSIAPHAGVGAGSEGAAAEAGATLRIGRDLDRLAPDGDQAFGDRARWYLYAAGSGQAVGYNWARDRDGDYSRAGVSRDDGAFMGDASIGVAMRRGNVHGSVGLVYREIEAEGMRAVHGVDTDVSEGLIAFQLSIKPD